MTARAAAMDLGARRLVALAGGHSFQGKAAGPGNTVETGKFALLGPLGFFAGTNGKVAGITAFQAGDVNIPSILEMDAAAAAQVKNFVGTGSGSVPIDGSLGKAFQIKEGKKSLREFLRAGGFVGYAIVLLGILAVTLCLFKLIEIARFQVPDRVEINGILDDLLEGNEDEAVARAKSLPGLAGRVVDAGAQHFFAKRRVLEDALYEKLSAVQPRLERFLPFLAVIAAAAPMAGLLGTVLGIMKTFEMMAAFGTGDAKVTAGGIGEALITTFLGLLVAIPAILVHGVLKSLARTRLGQVEGIALAMINGTTEIVSQGELLDEDAKTSGKPDDDDDDLLDEFVVEPAT
jgi:biopolymer transport protein ExbB